MLFMLNSSAWQMLNKKKQTAKRFQICNFGFRKNILSAIILFFFIYFPRGINWRIRKYKNLLVAVDLWTKNPGGSKNYHSRSLTRTRQYGINKKQIH